MLDKVNGSTSTTTSVLRPCNGRSITVGRECRVRRLRNERRERLAHHHHHHHHHRYYNFLLSNCCAMFTA
jgi:hypothetical protein